MNDKAARLGIGLGEAALLPGAVSLIAAYFSRANMTKGLAEVNPGLLRRVANQIRLNRSESPVYQQIADQLEQMLME